MSSDTRARQARKTNVPAAARERPQPKSCPICRKPRGRMPRASDRALARHAERKCPVHGHGVAVRLHRTPAVDA